MYTPSPELTALLIRDLYDTRTIGRAELIDLREQIGIRMMRMISTWANRYRFGYIKSPWLTSGGMFEHGFDAFLRDRMVLIGQHEPALGDIRDTFDMLREEMRDYVHDHIWSGAWGRLEVEEGEIIMRTLPVEANGQLAEIRDEHASR